MQINIDKFNVGRFTSHTNDGCPDGYMTISEQKLASVNTAAGVFGDVNGDISGGGGGGSGNGGVDTMANVDGNGNDGTRFNGNGKWCGNAWGYNVYYSESSSVNITLNLSKFTQQSQLSSTPKDEGFAFRITYKFLKRTDAKLR